MPLRNLIEELKLIVRLPEDPLDQLMNIVTAFYNDWNSTSAKQLRDSYGTAAHKRTHDLQPAVIVQQQVFGDFNSNSGSGVIFSRDPISGENRYRGITADF